METMSIKALATKALRGNQQGNCEETASFPSRKLDGPVSGVGNCPDTMTVSDGLYTIIYSRLLDDCLLLVRTKEQAEVLRRQGVEGVIYTGDEVQALKGKTPEQIDACHRVKKAFLGGQVIK